MHDPQRPRDSFSLGGWLMAELMLGLAMLFFAANTLGFVAGGAGTTPTPAPAWQATIVALETMQVDISKAATAAALTQDDAMPATVVQVTLTAVARSQQEVEATAAAYATQAAQPTPTLAPTSTPLPTSTPPPPTSTPLPTPTPDTTLAKTNAELESRIATMVALPSPTASPTPTPDACVETVNLDEIEIEVSAAEWNGADTEQRRAILRAHFYPYRGRHIGLSLTFGNHRTPSSAKELAEEANALLRETLPGMVDSGSILKDYSDWTGDKQDGSVTFLVYFMKDACVTSEE